MRKLATIRKISYVGPIYGADAIEVVKIDGWEIVAKKGEFKAGDSCVFFEIDSMLPVDHPSFAFLSERNIRNHGGRLYSRLKTMKMRGQLSQGLALPISSFDPKILEAEDIALGLGIIKYETPEERISNGTNNPAKGTRPFPPFIRKTDQERIQNCIHEIGNATDDYQVSIKLDGSSMTVWRVQEDSKYWEEACIYANRKPDGLIKKAIKSIKRFFGNKELDYVIGVCSRNVSLPLTTKGNAFVDHAINSGLVDKLKNVHRSIALQGELISPSIQQNHEQVKSMQWYMYSIFNIGSQTYYHPNHALVFAKDFDIPHVPLLSDLRIYESTDEAITLATLLGMADGPSMNPEVKREGLVFKSLYFPSRTFKVISNSYLLKKAKHD